VGLDRRYRGPQLVGDVHDQVSPAAVRGLGPPARLPDLTLLLADAQHVGREAAPCPAYPIEDVERDRQPEKTDEARKYQCPDSIRALVRESGERVHNAHD